MSARQLRAATEFIDAHIDQDLSLDKIAACAAMSPFRFSRGFRKATGQSPWRYVIVRRIERAKDLLRGSNHDLMEVAALTGFSTESHFTDAFRRLCGTTPSAIEMACAIGRMSRAARSMPHEQTFDRQLQNTKAMTCAPCQSGAVTPPAIPTHARVVIIGGGVIGCSVAYHLAKLGWREVLLLERHRLTSETTWHAAGLLTTLRETETQTHLAKYTQDLYRPLESEVGQATGFMPCGSIQLATTRDRAEEMRRGIQLAAWCGVEAHEIDSAEVKRHWPLACVDDLAAVLFPNDARANPTDVTQALAKGARAMGVRIVEQLPVIESTTRTAPARACVRPVDT